MNLFPVKSRVCDDSDSQGSTPNSILRSVNKMAVHDQPSHACEHKQKILVGNEMHKADSTHIPRWKRIFDITFILLSLPVWLVLMILLTMGIKIVSPGPVFFRQERIGYRGRRFICIKFRSMKVNVETSSHEDHLEQLIKTDCPMTKLDVSGDDRLIPWGRLFRASGLDELPQLFNVIRGEMSLVGPRPCIPNEFKRYQPWQQERVNAPPGLTGYWQVNGKNKTTFSEMINMDIFYGKHMSIWLDFKIMLRTFPAIIMQIFESQKRNNAGGACVQPIRER
jgi:exopolysaccharide production protein ExoY